MGHGSYEDQKKKVFIGMGILAVITLIEVGFSLFGKGHLGWNPEGTFQMTIPTPWYDFSFSPILALIGFALIALSLYKAYYIIFKFMHMELEVKGLAMSVLLPMGLLVWAVIAFFQEGSSWGERRNQIKSKDKQVSEESVKEIGMLQKDEETKYLY